MYEDVLKHIYRYLPMQNQALCRLVCKEWSFVKPTINIDRLRIQCIYVFRSIFRETFHTYACKEWNKMIRIMNYWEPIIEDQHSHTLKSYMCRPTTHERIQNHFTRWWQPLGDDIFPLTNMIEIYCNEYRAVLQDCVHNKEGKRQLFRMIVKEDWNQLKDCLFDLIFDPTLLVPFVHLVQHMHEFTSTSYREKKQTIESFYHLYRKDCRFMCSMLYPFSKGGSYRDVDCQMTWYLERLPMMLIKVLYYTAQDPEVFN
jgi:F-box domain